MLFIVHPRQIKLAYYQKGIKLNIWGMCYWILFYIHHFPKYNQSSVWWKANFNGCSWRLCLPSWSFWNYNFQRNKHAKDFWILRTELRNLRLFNHIPRLRRFNCISVIVHITFYGVWKYLANNFLFILDFHFLKKVSFSPSLPGTKDLLTAKIKPIILRNRHSQIRQWLDLFIYLFFNLFRSTIIASSSYISVSS